MVLVYIYIYFEIFCLVGFAVSWSWNLLFMDYVHANTCTHTLVVNTGISVSAVAQARINDIEWFIIDSRRCHVPLMEAAYIERIAGHAVHRARIVKAAGQAYAHAHGQAVTGTGSGTGAGCGDRAGTGTHHY